MNRRDLLVLLGSASAASFIPRSLVEVIPSAKGPFRYCLNTSTIMGQKPGLVKSIEIASAAGYDGVELWVNDINDYLAKGNSIESLASLLKSKKITVEDAISFTTWMVDDEQMRKAGLAQLEKEMKMLAALDCRRIAAPPAGISKGQPIDFKIAGDRYRQILDLGRKYNVMPLLEFWGASGTVYNLGQALAIAAAADDADAKILPDVYHLFRGGSGFKGLKLVSGRAIEIIHMNDYPGNKPVEEQTDGDRVYPGDGVAPLLQILRDLKAMGGVKVLSLELFNQNYWKDDALQVAKTGIQKMKQLVEAV